jgi:non-specific serine/threonine protein kinase
VDPEFPKAQALLGLVAVFRGKMQEAVHHLKRAVAVSPDEPHALTGLFGVAYIAVGRIDAAVPLYERYSQINPLDEATKLNKGSLPFYDGQYNRALQGFREFHELYPENPIGQFYYALGLAYENQMDEALVIIDKHMDRDPDNAFTKTGLMLKYALLGDREKAFEEMTPHFQNTCRRDCTLSHHLAGLFALVDAKNEALDWLENAVNRGFINYPLLSKRDPFLENIRDEERFKKLMERVKYEWEHFEV